MPAKKEDEKKVMDVANPGSAKPDTGSKPMVVGHKFLSKDPDVKSADSGGESEKEDSNVEQEPTTPKKKIVLAPISDNIKTDGEESKDDSSASEDSTKTEVNPGKKEQSPEEKSGDDPEIEEASEERTAEEKQSEEDKENLEKEERLQEIIKSKEYYVPIKHQGASAVKTFLATFILVCLLGAVLLAVLIDAEILDLGIDLPFDFL